MAETKEGLWDKLIVVVQTGLFGRLLAYFTHDLDRRIETYKQELAEQTEGVKALVQHYAPVMQQRETAYLELRQAGRIAVAVVEDYYFHPQTPIIRPSATQKARDFEYDLGLGSGSVGIGIAEKEDVVGAMWSMASVMDKYHDILSGTIRGAADAFFDTVMEDVRKAEPRENRTKDFQLAAHARLRERFDQLNNAIHRALRLDELPIK
jgi:hypothetical protein